MIGMSLVVSLAYVGLSVFKPRSAASLADLDRSNLILVRLACWLLAIGVALGAYWGDKAWGRWWGWDPKETWGLMTFLVYVAIYSLSIVLLIVGAAPPPARPVDGHAGAARLRGDGLHLVGRELPAGRAAQLRLSGGGLAFVDAAGARR